MNWFLIALGAPFLWALVNISDQYLVEKYSTGERSSGGLVLFSSLIGLIMALGIALFTSGLFAIPLNDKLLLLITGGITIAWVVLYLFALEIEDVSSVVPWFLTVPIFGYVFSYFLLGERLTTHQEVGSLVVLLGVVLLSINFSGEHKTFKWKPALYMIVACSMIAASGVIFKYVTISGNFWVSSFWEYLALGCIGILIYFFVPSYRQKFIEMNRMGGMRIFLVNIASELTTIAGNLLSNFALLLAPVAMVYLVGSFQPALLLILTLLGTRFFPHIVKENMVLHVLIPKIVAIVIMTAGSVFLFL